MRTEKRLHRSHDRRTCGLPLHQEAFLWCNVPAPRKLREFLTESFQGLIHDDHAVQLVTLPSFHSRLVTCRIPVT